MNVALILVALTFGGGAEKEFDVMAFLADPQDQRYPPPRRHPVSSSSSGNEFVDLGRMEGEAWAGMLMYSEDFESDSMPAGGIAFRAPSPWLSSGSKDFGFFVQITGGQVDRDLIQAKDPSGSVFFFGLGVDYALVDDAPWKVRGQLGIQYEHFGGVTELHDGFALIVGLAGSLDIASGVRIGVTPQWYIADAGDWVSAVHFGLSFQF